MCTLKHASIYIKQILFRVFVEYKKNLITIRNRKKYADIKYTRTTQLYIEIEPT